MCYLPADDAHLVRQFEKVVALSVAEGNDIISGAVVRGLTPWPPVFLGLRSGRPVIKRQLHRLFFFAAEPRRLPYTMIITSPSASNGAMHIVSTTRALATYSEQVHGAPGRNQDKYKIETAMRRDFTHDVAEYRWLGKGKG